MLTAVTLRKLAVASGVVALVQGHLSVGDFGFLLIALAYIFSLFREWRPARTLREELKDERALRADLEQKCDALEKECAVREQRLETLERSRDFSQSFEPLQQSLEQARKDATREHGAIVDAVEKLSAAVTIGLGEMVKSLSSNTAATGILAAGVHAETLPRHEKQ